jgi:predicted DNA-binding transcriptional regulator AlpA
MSEPAPRLAAVPSLAQLVEAPALLQGLPLDVLLELQRQVGHVAVDLAAAIARSQAQPAITPTQAGPERLLTPTEAAARLGTTVQWMYRHAGSLPFTRRLSRKVLRFSEAGLQRWQASRDR